MKMQVRVERGAEAAKVVAVAGDITTPEGRAAALAACPSPDILVNNAGGPPPGDFRNWSREDWIKALDANMLTPIELIKATVDGMIARKFGRIINITSGAVKRPIPELGLSNGARTGLTGFVAGISRQVVQHNVTINGLLPGPFDTDRLRGNFIFNAKKLGKTVEELAKVRADGNPAKRFGTIEEFGDACAFLCSGNAGYVTGQNLLLDGGAFPGTYQDRLGPDVGPALALPFHQVRDAGKHVRDAAVHVFLGGLGAVHGVLARNQADIVAERLGEATLDFGLTLEHAQTRPVGHDFDFHVLRAELGLHIAGVVKREVPLYRVGVADLEDHLLLGSLLRQRAQGQRERDEESENQGREALHLHGILSC